MPESPPVYVVPGSAPNLHRLPLLVDFISSLLRSVDGFAASFLAPGQHPTVDDLVPSFVPPSMTSGDPHLAEHNMEFTSSFLMFHYLQRIHPLGATLPNRSVGDSPEDTGP